MRTTRLSAMTLALGTICTSCTANRQVGARDMAAVEQKPSLVTNGGSNSLRGAVEDTMTDARRAVNENGISEGTMQRICESLGRLAREPDLKEEYSMRQLHGGGASSVVLASEGDDGLTLRLSKFEPGKPTPIHDHGSWAVAYVMEGRDEYTHYKRADDGHKPDHAKLDVLYRKVLNPGDCVHWTDPPHDIHSQQAMGETTWELVLFGKNHGKTQRQYFDPMTGQITRRMPQ